MARVLIYRDMHGYLMSPDQQPIFLKDVTKAPTACRVAHYVTCPEIQGLKHISHCEECQLFGGHIKYTGVYCMSSKELKLPECYNK